MQPGGLVNTQNWGISLDWTEDEQKTLEAYMARYPGDKSDPVQRYVRIAMGLPRKTIRDVALRVRWTIVQNQMKRRTGVDLRGQLPTGMPPPPLPGPKPLASQPSSSQPIPPPYMPSIPLPPAVASTADGHPTIDGPVAYLLEANIAILNHFRSNTVAFKVHENTQLLVQFRDNILQIIQAMDAMGGVMADMPPLPVRLNVDLANSFLPSRPAGVMTYDGGMMMPPPPQPALNAPGMVPLNGPGVGSIAKPPVVAVAGQPIRPPPPPAIRLPMVGTAGPPVVPAGGGVGKGAAGGQQPTVPFTQPHLPPMPARAGTPGGNVRGGTGTSTAGQPPASEQDLPPHP